MYGSSKWQGGSSLLPVSEAECPLAPAHPSKEVPGVFWIAQCLPPNKQLPTAIGGLVSWAAIASSAIFFLAGWLAWSICRQHNKKRSCCMGRHCDSMAMWMSAAENKDLQNGSAMDEEVKELLQQKHIDIDWMVEEVPMLQFFGGQRVRMIFNILESYGIDVQKALYKDPTLIKREASSLQSNLQLLEQHGLNVRKATSSNPQLLVHNTGILQQTIDDMTNLGLDATRMLSLNPRAFGTSLSRLQSTMTYVQQLDLDPKEVLTKYPKLLSLSVDNMENTLQCLQSLHIDAKEVIRRHPHVLGMGIAKIEAKAAFLESLGINAARVLTAAPQMLGLSIRDNLAPKLQYLQQELGRRPEEVNNFPAFLTYSLAARIQPRHQFLKTLGRDKCTLPSLLAGPDKKFTRVTAGCALADYHAWLLAWKASHRSPVTPPPVT
eukprot:GGOE01044904.1.p1 GENE.GGOE01044904.1~~GGOE01044904.1.p1  ORF type:complete len:502 (-),score=97.56 GGOE01044904.1:68-1372(-)